MTLFYKHFCQNIISNNSVGHGMYSGVKTGHYWTYILDITSQSVTCTDITNIWKEQTKADEIYGMSHTWYTYIHKKKILMAIILKRHLRQNAHNGITALLMLQFRPEISLSHTHYNHLHIIISKEVNMAYNFRD